MTLSERNFFFKTGIFFSAAVILLILAASFLTIPMYPEIEENTRRPAYFFQTVSGSILGNNYYAVHSLLALAAIFSFTVMLLIHIFFERTPAPEILYIAFFVISLSFEALRLLLPLHLVLNFPSIYLRIATRVLLFARFVGIFSLLTASLCASGMDVQKNRNAIFIIIIAALAVTIGVPIDSQTWDTGFNLITGYLTMFRVVEILVFLITIASFLIASKIRDTKEYIFVAVGVMLALMGRNILLYSDNWITVGMGIVMLALGTWFLCTRIHKINLWM